MKEIILTNTDMVGLVDDEDYDSLSACLCGIPVKWRSKPSGGRSFYIVRSARACCDGQEAWRKRRHIKIHNVLMNPPKGMVVDHINHNSLDNRRENLRICTQAENLRNRPKWGKNKYKGVVRESTLYKAYIQNEVIGYYKSAEMAARAFNKEAKKLYGEFAVLNDVPALGRKYEPAQLLLTPRIEA